MIKVSVAGPSRVDGAKGSRPRNAFAIRTTLDRGQLPAVMKGFLNATLTIKGPDSKALTDVKPTTRQFVMSALQAMRDSDVGGNERIALIDAVARLRNQGVSAVKIEAALNKYPDSGFVRVDFVLIAEVDNRRPMFSYQAGLEIQTEPPAVNPCLVFKSIS